MDNASTKMFEIIRYAICNADILNDTISSLDENTLAKIYSLSKHHDVAQIVAYGLEKKKLLNLNSKACQAFSDSLFQSVMRFERLDYTYKSVARLFEENNIAFIPLKGIVMRKLYPENYLRTSCDIDILVKEAELDRAVKLLEEKLLFKVDSKSTHDVLLIAKNGTHFELHYTLFEYQSVIKEATILNNAWNYVVSDVPKAEHKFSDEFFLYYHLLHMVKHIQNGGCGVRPFIDLYYLRKLKLDNDKLFEFLNNSKLKKFYEMTCKLCDCWFNGDKFDKATENYADYLLKAGVYGSFENNIAVKQAQKGGRLGYLWLRLFIPYDQLIIKYPSLKGKKLLTPFYQIRRWFSVIFSKKMKSKIDELKLSNNLSEEKKQMTEKLLNDLGLTTAKEQNG